MSDFNNQTIWITGASSGIGKALAIQLAAKGARIILTARSVQKLENVKNQLKGTEHLVYPMDLLDNASILPKTGDLLKKVGQIDILINNAGVSQRSLVKDTSLDVDRKIMELDHFAAVSLTKGILPHMLARKSGHIVTISSIAGKLGTPMRSAYCAAKHAIIGFMDSLRAEVHQSNIKVLVVTPGSIKTDISINALEGDGKAHGVTDPAIANGIAVEECAKQIIAGIQNNTSELLIAKGKERLAAYLKRFFPNVLYKMVSKTATT
jgi:short-subunit dehydrogenase